MEVEKLKTELVRKGIHFLIALTPALASLHKPGTMVFLAGGTLFYVGVELLRFSGRRVPFISSITKMASRPRDEGHFVLGPVTLGAGAFLALLVFEPLPAAIAIYALAFGDGLSGIIGRVFGRLRPRFLLGKSVEGCLSCFAAVFVSAWLVCRDAPVTLAAALCAMVIEALPLRNWDNIIFPLAVGFAVQVILRF
jgi:dolichol kinase